MKNSRTRKILVAAILVIALAAMLAVVNSFGFSPDPGDTSTFMARAQQKSASGIKVDASALGESESRQFFGENLARRNIQPVWLSIENQTDDQLTFIPVATDPDYYSPYEVAYRFRGLMSFAANRARNEFFLSHQIANVLPAHSKTTGFMYGVLDAGIKYAHIVIAGPKRVETFEFALPVPGPKFVGTDIGTDTIYPGKKINDLDLESLRTTFAKQVCCTTNADDTRNGDPLNLVIVENRQSPIVPFISRGWHLARQLDFASDIETARAFIFRDEFLTSPVSPLYVFNRREDFVLQKARSTINERVHARFWLTPYTFEGRRVWIGQVSRDIGVRLTTQTWNLTTHKVAPDVDFDRAYMLQDMLLSGFVERYGYVDGVGAAPASAPRTNLTGDPYYTDGLRAVIFLSNQTAPLGNIERLPWNIPLAPREEAGRDAQ
ncbi:LssY C-terminal domain-containing protein [Bradyrhizobium sp. UFLA05-153]